MKKKQFISAVILSLLALQTLFAQTEKDYEKLKKSMWSDADFQATETPEKWKNESAVILAKSYEYSVRKEVIFNYIYENIYLHKRIKLIDKSAINEYSEFSFEEDYANYVSGYEFKDFSIGIKVIKPSGKENIIDLKNAVVKQIKEGKEKLAYKKIAIPDLEPGDIIDYFYVIKNTYFDKYLKIMDPAYYQLVEQYPIAKQKFNVHILHRIFFNSKSINGAPELIQTDKEDETSYSLVDTDREKADASLWSYPLRTYPTLKYQAFFVKKKAFDAIGYQTFFLKERKSNNNSLDFDNIKDLVDKIYVPRYDSYLTPETSRYMIKNLDKKSPSDTIVKYTYYHIRQYQGIYSKNALMLNLSLLLQYKKIKHDLVITVPNYISDVSDLIIPREMSYFIRIKGEPDYFIGDFSPISSYKSIGTEFQGNNAYAVSNPKLEKNPKVEKIVIPVDSSDENSEFTKINVKISDDSKDTLELNIDKSIKGVGREDEIALLFSNKEYQDEVKLLLDSKIKSKSKPKKKKSKELKEEKERQQKHEQNKKDSEEALKNYYKSEYDCGDDFTITSSSAKQMGIWDFSPELQYSVGFRLGNLVKKMGPNYLVSIGKIMGHQLELNKKDLERKIDIYAPYARSFATQINFEIPAGYKVKGLEKLNVNIANPTGGFIAKAEILNNNLVINVKKYYKHNFEKVSEWPKMVEFIEAAYTYTQQNILLEKK